MLCWEAWIAENLLTLYYWISLKRLAGCLTRSCQENWGKCSLTTTLCYGSELNYRIDGDSLVFLTVWAVDGFLREEFGVFFGVPWRQVLGTVLFLVYINDIAEDIYSSIPIRLFADDCFIYIRINALQGYLSLNEAFESIVSWYRKRNMTESVFTCSLENTAPY